MAGISVADMKKEVEQAIYYGEQVRFRYFTSVINAGSYDSDVTLTSGVDIWTSGLHQPVKDINASQEGLTQEFGKQERGDKILYITGDTTPSGTFKIGLGSPSREEYAPISKGIQPWYSSGEIVYYKITMKELTTGSLIGE